MLGELPASFGLIQDSLATARAVGYPFGITNALIQMAHLAQAAGNFEQARAVLEEALVVARAAGDVVATYMVLAIRAIVHLGRGELGLAASDCEEVLNLARPRGDRWFTASGLATLALVEMVQGSLEQAVTHARESLALNWETRNVLSVAWSLETLAWIAGAQAQLERAGRLLGTADAARDRVSFPLFPAEQAGHDRTVALIRAQLDEEALAACRSEGRALAPARAVAYALTAEGPSGPSAARRRGIGRPALPAAPGPAVLTRRERDVVVAVAHGLTNQEISHRLVIAEGTTANHVRHILGKLGFRWRSQIAAWAVAHGLVQAPLD